LNLTSKFSKYLLTFLTLSLISGPIGVSAQVSKTPILRGDVPVIEETDPYVLPEDYPQDILDWYASNIDARSYVVMDGETNRVLAEQKANTRYPIASMSKVASIYLVYQAIKDGKLKMDDKIEIPQAIEDNMSFNPEMSAMGLYGGVEYTVKDLIYGVMLLSGNDATSALMWHLYGSEQDSVKAVRELLTSWGMTNFEFYTVSGIPNQYIPEDWWIEGSVAENENQMTASDVALMAQHIVRDFPEVLEVTSAESYVAQEGTEYEVVMSNPNQLLPGGAYERAEITGLKSGMTDAAGKNFVASGKENGREIYVVVMGLFDTAEMVMSTYWEVEILLDKLAEYPELYKNEGLPVNQHEKPVEEETTVDGETDQSDEIESLIKEHGIPNENRRDNPITNFMKDIFNFFK